MGLIRDIDAGTITLAELEALMQPSEGAAKLSKLWNDARKRLPRRRK